MIQNTKPRGILLSEATLKLLIDEWDDEAMFVMIERATSHVNTPVVVRAIDGELKCRFK